MAKGPRKQARKKGGKGDTAGLSTNNHGDTSNGRRPMRKRNSTKVSNNSDNDLRTAVEADGTKEIIDMDADGNCLFRSLSDQLFRDYGQNHVEVRQDVCDFMEGHTDEFKLFLVLDDDDASEEDASDFETYLENMRTDGEWGGNLELVAAARMYRRDVRVFSANLAAFTVPHGTDKPASGPELLLSYHDNDHYNSVRLTRPAKLTAPIRTFVKAEWEPSLDKKDGLQDENMNVDITYGGFDDTKATVDGGDSDTDIVDKINAPEPPKQTSPSVARRQLTRHAKCPCNSGLKYRKCCYAKERLELNVANSKLGSDYLARDVDNDVEGQFRILHI